MKYKVLLLLLSVFLLGCMSKEKDVLIVNYVGLRPFLEKNNDKIYVINFWATWCSPCVEELPAFQKLYKNYKDDNVELVLVSLDFPNQLDETLIPFLEKEKLEGELLLLDDPDQNSWIPKVDKKWSGAIPATLIYKNNKRVFFEQSFTYESLVKELKPFLK